MDLKFVSIIIPVRNGRDYLDRCLKSVLSQDYPRDLLEVIVVDGLSSDGTRDIVAKYAKDDARLKLLDNPGGITPSALNIGIKNSRGAIIVRVDAQTEISKVYVRNCVKIIEETRADCVGGNQIAVGKTIVGKAIADFLNSRFSGSEFHYLRGEKYVDTVYLGAYKRKVFEDAGFFDETLVRDQDEEFNYRLVERGLKILLTTKLVAFYHCRDSIYQLSKQYFWFGLYKPKVLVKHPSRACLRHLAPSALSLGILVFLLGLYSGILSALPLKLLVGLYMTYVFMVSLYVSLRNNFEYFPFYALIFTTVHFSYGIGFLLGLSRSMMGL